METVLVSVRIQTQIFHKLPVPRYDIFNLDDQEVARPDVIQQDIERKGIGWSQAHVCFEMEKISAVCRDQDQVMVAGVETIAIKSQFNIIHTYGLGSGINGIDTPEFINGNSVRALAIDQRARKLMYPSASL